MLSGVLYTFQTVRKSDKRKHHPKPNPETFKDVMIFNSAMNPLRNKTP